MGRSYELSGVVSVPRLDVPGALALGVQVITAAEAEALPDTLRKPLARLKSAVEALQTAAVAQAPAAQMDSPRAREADTGVDGTWGGLLSVLTGMARFPGIPAWRDNAQPLIDALYPNALAFTQVAFVKQWAEVGTRLKRIDEQNLAPRFEALGLSACIPLLKATHAEYGLALGITEVAPEQSTLPSLLEPLQLVGEALRVWVVKVLATIEDDEPATEERARRLLRPLEEWKTRPATAPNPPASPATPEPVDA